MFKNQIKHSFYLLLFMILISSSLYGKDKIYFLPNDADIAKKDIVNLLKNADTSIDIAMYNFTYKKFNKAIKKAIKNDAKVTIIYNKTKLNFDKKIELIKTKRKQHIKLAIIDDKYAIYGSANWKSESFGENYEIINITNDKKRVKKFIEIYKKLKEEN